MARTKRNGSSHFPSHLALPPSPSSIDERAGKEPRRAKNTKRSSGNKGLTAQRELPELCGELLDLIAKRLSVADFCAFGAVCKRWFDIFQDSKKDYMASQAPLAVLISSHAKRACYLYDMSNAKRLKIMLPSLVGKFYVGCSAGYLVIEDYNCQISLINPFTGHERNFPSPPNSDDGRKYLHDRIILASTKSADKCFIILALSISRHFLQVYHSRYNQWAVFRLFAGELWVDVAVLRNKVYGVTYNGKIGVLHLLGKGQTYGMFRMLTENTTVKSHDFKLVVSDNNELFMVDFVPGRRLNIFKMDFEERKLVKVDSLGDQALFWGEKKGSAMRNPGKWGGRTNCVYRMETLSTLCCVYSMEAKLIARFPLVENPVTSTLLSHCWYYPHQCLKIEELLDD